MQHEHSSIRHAIEHRSRAQYVTAQPVRAQKDERSRIQHTIAGHSTPYHATATIAGHSRAQQGKSTWYHGTAEYNRGGTAHSIPPQGTAHHIMARHVTARHKHTSRRSKEKRGTACTTWSTAPEQSCRKERFHTAKRTLVLSGRKTVRCYAEADCTQCPQDMM